MSIPSHISPSDEAAILAAYADGATVNQLQKAYGTGWSQIAKVLRAHGVYEGRVRQHVLRQEAEICRRYVAGESLNMLGAAFGCSAARILQILKKYEVPRRPAGAQVPEYAEEVRKLREQGMGSRKIAKELGIGTTTARKWIVRFGLADPPDTYRVGPENPTWRGGARVMGDYRVVWLPKGDPMQVMAWSKGYIPEHRLVMARKLGRPLERHETVHHINGDTLDNRPENLQLRNGGHGKGARFACLDCGSHNVKAVAL